MEARLLRDSSDLAVYTIALFSKGGVYTFTHKGLRVIQDFIEGNAIENEADHLIALLAKLPMPRPPLIRVKRIQDTRDELLLTQNIAYSLFCAFCGREPNYGLGNSKGVILIPRIKRNALLQQYFKNSSAPFNGQLSEIDTSHCIEVQSMTRWLLAFTSANGAADAVHIGAEFLRFGLIVLIKEGKGDAAKHTHTARGPSSTLNPVVHVS